MSHEGLVKIAQAVTASTIPVKDEAGGFVASLTEAVMGITAGLMEVAHAINDLAEAVREHGTPADNAD